MHIPRSTSRSYVGSILIAACCTIATYKTASAAGVVANNTPPFVQAATTRKLGPADPAEVIDVSLWLSLHNRSSLDSLYNELYDKNSPKYRSWLKHQDFVGQFAPTAVEARQVANYLSARGLKVIRVGPDNMYVRAQGTVAVVSKAFQVAINRYEVNGKEYRANASDPIIDGTIANLVQNVSGLTDVTMSHPVETAVLGPGKSSGSASFGAADLGAGLFEAHCFTSTTTEILGIPSQYPNAVAKGNKYNFGVSGCGYTPDEIRTAYNLWPLYKAGYDGTGQTVVLIDWCGSPTVLADANTFSARFGLPVLNESTFKIIEYPTPSTCSSPSVEINIDVEWAHAVAPGAKILLLVSPSSSSVDLDEAEYFAIVNGLGNVISGSYGAEEFFAPKAEVLNESLLNEIAAVSGIAANFSTGDEGDFSLQLFPLSPPSVQIPADSPYATAVGGVTLALNNDNTIKWQTGWGTNQNVLVSSGFVPVPPSGFFRFGSGGGASAVFSKPGYQKTLAGSQRQLPDISWLADPYTGGIIVISEPFQVPEQIYAVYGGTSLACPMFSGLWAIANQEAGMALGQAAPYLYSMPKGSITDVLPLGSNTNVTESINVAPKQVENFSASALAAPLFNTKTFYGALWDYPLLQDTTALLTFGTDTHLVVATGWDNVTGLGTPNGKEFADYFNPAK